MKLTEETVYQYLHKRQLINENEVINGNFMVHPVQTRNYNMKILINEKDSLFVKQMDTDVVSNNLFNREVYTYNLFKNNTNFNAIASYVPQLLDYNDDDNILVTELVYNSKNLNEYYVISKELKPEIAEEQAKILSKCHVAIKDKLETNIYPKLLPWVLQLDKFEAHQFFENNEFSANVIGLIKTNDVLQGELIKLAKSWKYSHLIHGDIKWINFLITEDKDGIKQKLIDWELADIGDPLWDVAGLLQSYISTWLQSIDNTASDYKLLDHMACFDIKKMQPSVQGFLYKYIELQKIPDYKHHEFFEKVMQLTAARIIQTSLEEVTYTSEIKAKNMRYIQLAFNILKDPMESLTQLFNTRIEAYV